MTDPLVIRWVSIAVTAAIAALALWAFSDSRERRRSPRTAEQADGRVVARLEIRRPGLPAQRVAVETGALLGRARDCVVPFDDAAVSKWHARLHCEGTVATIEDMASTNGTFVNGQRIETPTPLRRGDRIGLGTNQIVFQGIERAGRAHH
ncbi:MAG TPA: FHA domain-containing protein [Candidatus Eremiobacteraceae bacterium]|nr:FHA domain-containing protein [Candidatus Eremiobacteraceae bacterium]